MSLNYGAVIVTFNRKKLLLEAVTALLNQTESPQKIIIIDNASSDGTELALSSANLLNNPIIDYHRLTTNVGGAGGFYEGVKIAEKYNFDWLSLSDDDAIFHDDYFTEMDNAVVSNPDVKAFAGTVKLVDGRIQFDQRMRLRNWTWLGELRTNPDEYDKDFDIDLLTFCGAFINMKIIRQIGLPEKGFFIWHDDIEYSIRIREHSRIINVHKAILTHKTNIPSIDYSSHYAPDWREYYGHRNHIITVLKHTKRPVLARLWVVYWILKMEYAAMFGKQFTGYRKHELLVLHRSFWDGVRNHQGLCKKYLPGSTHA